MQRPVAAIAHDNGFVSLAHFSRLFRRTYGIAPGEYRQLALAALRPVSDAAEPR